MVGQIVGVGLLEGLVLGVLEGEAGEGDGDRVVQDVPTPF